MRGDMASQPLPMRSDPDALAVAVKVMSTGAAPPSLLDDSGHDGASVAAGGECASCPAAAAVL